jgi:GABA(A) receptor-associated protein
MSHLQLRDGELDRIRKNYPDKIPIFITKSSYAKDSLPEIRKKKFLVPCQFTMGEFVATIRRWLLLTPEQAIFIFIENTMPCTGSTIGQLYQEHKSPDGVLRVTYASENTFGSNSFDVSCYTF